MKKIGEALQSAFNKIPEETIEINGEKIRQGGIVSIVPGMLLTGFANILIVDAAIRSGIDPTKNKTIKKLTDVIGTELTPLSMQQYMQLQGFLNWWVEQSAEPVETEDDSLSWFDLPILIERWNEYAEGKNAGAIA